MSMSNFTRPAFGLPPKSSSDETPSTVGGFGSVNGGTPTTGFGISGFGSVNVGTPTPPGFGTTTGSGFGSVNGGTLGVGGFGPVNGGTHTTTGSGFGQVNGGTPTTIGFGIGGFGSVNVGTPTTTGSGFGSVNVVTPNQTALAFGTPMHDRAFSSAFTQQSVVPTNRPVNCVCHPNTTTSSVQPNVSSSSPSGLEEKKLGTKEEIHKSSEALGMLQISFDSPNEVTLRNVKCIAEKSEIQNVNGPTSGIQYKEMLINNVLLIKAEFISYDSVIGEWKFRVQHF